ncbi:carbohydrate ABC transporter permease [Actinomadura opuntiae]|uniref:carbohydrate ABC transporter permease n=1 Tax=Actinomadura sp. OS1-43 TaxID=604315 RepID=UPI00255AE1CC|nr:sugar ABC transporter permease [Actinomadura sp. OS1-43]MDL4821815.1 sugar ABC transporter permease [Actinomadura sp. OS1-43]
MGRLRPRAASPSSRAPHARARRREAGTALLFLLPQLFGLVAFVGLPLAVSLYYSFTHWDLVAPAPTWIGLENWSHLPSDERVPKVLWNTVKFILTGTTSFLLLSLVAALFTYRPRRGVAVYRALLFLPYVLSQIAVGIVWRWMFNTESGPITGALELFGLKGPEWLLDPATAMPAIALVTTWQGIGYGMTLYVASLHGVPASLPEAAKIDGANAWQRFRHVLLPMISPTVLFLMVTSLIGALQLFDPVVAMTTSGGNIKLAGGPDDSTRTVVLYMYNQMFNYNERLSGLGYAAAIAWVLALLTFALTLVQWTFGKRWVFYTGDPSATKGGEG